VRDSRRLAERNVALICVGKLIFLVVTFRAMQGADFWLTILAIAFGIVVLATLVGIVNF
jgi:hypothetical protein